MLNEYLTIVFHAALQTESRQNECQMKEINGRPNAEKTVIGCDREALWSSRFAHATEIRKLISSI